MAQDFEFPADQKLIFPEMCVCCGRPKEAEITLTVNRLVMQKQKQVNRSVVFPVPLCLRCKKADARVLLLSIFVFAIGLLVVGIGCFVLLTMWDSQVGVQSFLGIQDNRRDPGFWIGAGLSFLAGVAGGFLLEAVVKILFVPLLGRTLYYAPFLAVQLLGDVEYAAGLRAQLTPDGKTLRLRFHNDKVAESFRELSA